MPWTQRSAALQRGRGLSGGASGVPDTVPKQTLKRPGKLLVDFAEKCSAVRRLAAKSEQLSGLQFADSREIKSVLA